MQNLPNQEAPQGRSPPGVIYATGVLVLVFAVLVVGLVWLHTPIQLLMLISFIVSIPCAVRIGYSYKEVEAFAFNMIYQALPVIFIYLAVGALIGAWILSGTVPTMIYAGLEIISPKYFFVTTLLLCSMTSLAVGTSFGTIGTMGIALMGVASALGLPASITAGAIICGAVFGDKMSPLSDTTNLAPAICGTDLMSHVKHMTWTTMPALFITGVIFTAIGLHYEPSSGVVDQVGTIASTMRNTFKLGFIPMIPAVVVLVLLVLQKPAFVSIFIGALVGVLVAVTYQGASVSHALVVTYGGYHAKTGVIAIDNLLSTGGVVSFLDLVALVLAALGLAGILSGSGILQSLLNSFADKLTTDRRLVLASLAVTLVCNMIGSAINVALVMAGTLMAPLYAKSDLDPKNLSRATEDAGTMTGFIIPWNLAATFAAKALGVSPMVFIPFCFICFLTPLISALYAVTGFTITRKSVVH